MDQLLDQILAQTYTKEQALIRLHVLRDLVLVKLFGKEKAASFNKTGHHSPMQQTSWIVSLGPDIYKHFNRKNVYKIFNTLEEEITKIQPLVVYLPFEIPVNELSAVGVNLRKNYGKRFLLETKLDPSLIAGTALVWNGIYKDYSIRKKIADNRQLILKTLKEYVQYQSTGMSLKSQVLGTKQEKEN